MRAVGHGKVILLGEHAVVYGHAALAGALALGVRAQATCASHDRLRVAEWGIDTDAQPDSPPAHALGALGRALAQRLNHLPAHDVVATATVPPRAGLGSSAALAVAITRARLESLGLTLDDATVEAIAQEAEKVFHGNPSGVDVALATRGGLGVYRRGAGLTPVTASPFRLAIGLSGEPRDTAQRVADVARQREAHPAATDAKLADLGSLAEEGAARLHRSEDLGPLFDRAHEILASLGLSSPGLDRLCELARGAGAAGAKLTGAGGGGAVIAVGREAEVLCAWRRAGLTGLLAEVGQPT
jgi:mevalonate kinase